MIFTFLCFFDSLQEVYYTFCEKTELRLIEKLQKTLAMYVTYFTDDITKSINYTKAFFPMNLDSNPSAFICRT